LVKNNISNDPNKASADRSIWQTLIKTNIILLNEQITESRQRQKQRKRTLSHKKTSLKAFIVTQVAVQYVSSAENYRNQRGEQ